MAEVKGVSGAASGVVPGPQDRDHDPKKIADAARQFEALLIGQLLKTSRGSSGNGWMGTGDDQAGSQAIDLAEEQMAEALAQQGGLGLASLVMMGLRQKADAARTPPRPAKPTVAPSATGSLPAAKGANSAPPSGPVPGSKAAFQSRLDDASRAGSVGVHSRGQ
jgi:Rod binding domain-containing protein